MATYRLHLHTRYHVSRFTLWAADAENAMFLVAIWCDEQGDRLVERQPRKDTSWTRDVDLRTWLRGR